MLCLSLGAAYPVAAEGPLDELLVAPPGTTLTTPRDVLTSQQARAADADRDWGRMFEEYLEIDVVATDGAVGAIRDGTGEWVLVTAVRLPSKDDALAVMGALRGPMATVEQLPPVSPGSVSRRITARTEFGELVVIELARRRDRDVVIIADTNVASEGPSPLATRVLEANLAAFPSEDGGGSSVPLAIGVLGGLAVVALVVVRTRGSRPAKRGASAPPSPTTGSVVVPGARVNW